MQQSKAWQEVTKVSVFWYDSSEYQIPEHSYNKLCVTAKKGLCITKYKKSEYNTIVEVRKIHKLNVIHHERSFPNVLLRISPNCLPLLHWYIFLVNVMYQQFPICISDMDLLFAVWWYGCIAQNTKKNNCIHSNTLILKDPLRKYKSIFIFLYEAQYSRCYCNEKLNSFLALFFCIFSSSSVRLDIVKQRLSQTCILQKWLCLQKHTTINLTKKIESPRRRQVAK